MTDYADSATDTWLVARVAQQDEAALMKLYARHGSLVYGTALRVLRSPGPAEEVTQDVFLRVWRRPERWNPALGAFPAWLTTITQRRHRPAAQGATAGTLGAGCVGGSPAPVG
ncbi:MAG: sigma factor [Caldilineaceae bacterium]